MKELLYIAASLVVIVSAVHSILGERYILLRLFRLDNIPKLFDSTDFTVRTLRFAWHLTSVAWLGLALILVHLANPPITIRAIGNIIGAVFLIHFLVALIGSRGKHLSWPFFLIISVFTIWATRM